MKRPSSVDGMVDHLFRHEAGKLVATLTRIFGPAHLELAEDMVQETLLVAIEAWSDGEIPDNPAAWITQVAKRKVLNELKHRQRSREHELLLRSEFSTTEKINDLFMETEVKDSQLRLMFACCHPGLALESQLSLTLKTLGGFGIPEIANALLTNESTINKRLYRAKQMFRSGKVALTIPMGPELVPRISAVAHTLYLMFNEGYRSSSNQLIKKDLCLEALRLCKLMADQINDPAAFALLSLFCFHTARLDARLDRNGTIVIFEDQDRSKWDKSLISKGMSYLHKAAVGKELTSYHLEAGIAAEHCLADHFDDTNWKSIEARYKQLYKMQKNPVILLNLAIVRSRTQGLNEAITALLGLENIPSLSSYFLLPATIGTFYLRLGEKKKARNYFLRALSGSLAEPENNLIRRQLQKCE